MRTLYPSLVILIVAFSMSCNNDDEIKIPKSSEITGRLFYIDPATGKEIMAPKGTPVKVALNADGFRYYGYSFTTINPGILFFQPPVTGSYDVIIKVTDSLLQFDPTLVVPAKDLDSTRKAEYALIDFNDSTRFEIGSGDNFDSQDFLLTQQYTSLLLTVTDDSGNRLKGIRVCIYDNEKFANQNSPYCGGSISYLLTNENGEALFTELQPKEYFVNARGTVGNVSINNQFNGANNKTDVLTEKKINKKTIVLK